jgi:hypothetical protein
VVDRQARKEFNVEPRQFTGELLHNLPAPRSVLGEIYVEIYLNPPDAANAVGLYRSGTRILASLSELEAFQRAPWTEGYLQGILDVPFLTLTPATRTGVVHDAALESFVAAMAALERALAELIDRQKQAEEERSNRDTLRAIQRAFREAMLALPPEEYQWFDISARVRGSASGAGNGTGGGEHESDPPGLTLPEGEADVGEQRQFFEFAGPLHSVRITPSVCTLPVGTSRTLRAVARDASRRQLDSGVEFAWRVVEGGGRIQDAATEHLTYQAPEEPCLVRLAVAATQGEIHCEAEALVTVTDSLLPESKERPVGRHGLPGYTLDHAPGQLWRSRYDDAQNVIVVNSGHRDYVHASRLKTLKLRYLVRLYAKEMVKRNFPGLPADQLLDRLIELSLYAEEQLR